MIAVFLIEILLGHLPTARRNRVLWAKMLGTNFEEVEEQRLKKERK
jgi:hypothetical protein